MMRRQHQPPVMPRQSIARSSSAQAIAAASSRIDRPSRGSPSSGLAAARRRGRCRPCRGRAGAQSQRRAPRAAAARASAPISPRRRSAARSIAASGTSTPSASAAAATVAIWSLPAPARNAASPVSRSAPGTVHDAAADQHPAAAVLVGAAPCTGQRVRGEPGASSAMRRSSARRRRSGRARSSPPPPPPRSARSTL